MVNSNPFVPLEASKEERFYTDSIVENIKASNRAEGIQERQVPRVETGFQTPKRDGFLREKRDRLPRYASKRCTGSQQSRETSRLTGF